LTYYIEVRRSCADAAKAYTCTSCPTKITDLGFSYFARGDVTDTYESHLIPVAITISRKRIGRSAPPINWAASCSAHDHLRWHD